jgi:ABC-2 type transport system permease protein
VRNLRHVWFIAVNNVRLFVIDRLAMGMFILFPFLFVVMFNILLSETGGGDQRLELHLATREAAGISQQIIQAMVTADESQLQPGDPIIVQEKDYDQAKADVEAGKLSGFLAFPSDFTQNLQAGKNTELEIVTGAEATDIRMALMGLAQSIASRIGSQTAEINAEVALLQQQGKSPAEIQQTIATISQSRSSDSVSPPLISYQVQTVGEAKPFSASSFVIPGYLVMFVFFAAAMGSIDIIRERRNHTLERLLATSVRKESILGGVYLGGFFRGLVQIAIFWTAGILIFHIDMGVAPWAVIVLSLLVVLMSASFSLMLATLVKTERGASALGVLCSLVLAPLGGCWWPLFIVPRWMQFLAKFTPHGWANDGFNKLMLFGASGGDALWNMLALVGFALAFIIVAIILFRTGAEAT